VRADAHRGQGGLVSRERWVVRVADRAAAVERALGVLRRRAVLVEDLTVSRASASSIVIVAAVRVDEAVATRVCAELEAHPDVLAVERVPEAVAPPPPAPPERPARPDAGTRPSRNPELRQPRGSEPMTGATLYDGTTADAERLRGRRVAVIGYGSQGHAHALNLRDSGLDVVVGLHEGSVSAERARREGLRVMTVDEAAREADLVALLIPDPVAPGVYRERIAPHLGVGDTLLFAHGFNVHYGEIDAPAGVDTILVAPKSPGDMVRREYRAGRGVPALVAVHRDASGHAAQDALAYAAALGCTRAGVLETTFAAETETDLFGEQAVLCGGFSSLVKAGFDTLVEAGYDPRLAYFECLHELKLIVDLAYARGLSGMRREVSDTAEYGDYVSGDRVIGDSSRAAMRDILAEIRSGEFARRWIDEWSSGGAGFKGMREREGGHLIDQVGRGLRARMAWLGEEEGAAAATAPAGAHEAAAGGPAHERAVGR
jgi:ketol-acid reductoisomerase